MPRTAALVCAVSAAAMLAASAANAEAYAGAALTRTNLDHAWPYSSDRQRTKLGLSANGGYRFGRSFAIEGSFTDYGKTATDLIVNCVALVGAACPSGASVSTNALSVSAVGLFPIQLVELFVRGGLARWSTKATISGSLQPGTFISVARDSGSDVVLGVGVRLPVDRFGLRVEYERLALADDTMGTISVGFVYGFGKSR